MADNNTPITASPSTAAMNNSVQPMPQDTSGDVEKKRKEAEANKETRQKHLEALAISQEMFSLPEMGDFYLGAVDDIYMRKIDAVVNGDAENTKDADAKKGDGKKSTFYTENPPMPEPGVDGNQNYFFKVDHSDDSYDEGNWNNGNTLRIKVSDLSGGENGANALSVFKENALASNIIGKMGESDSIHLTLYGINAPYPSRYATEEDVPKDAVEIKTVSAKEAIKDSAYTTDPECEDGEQRKFVHLGQRWYECEITNETSSTVSFKWMVTPRNGAKKSSQAAMAKLNKLIKGGVWVVIDESAKVNSAPTNFQYISDDQSAIKQLKAWAGSNTSGFSNGYCLAKEDWSLRRTGVAYVKVDGKWVNLAKAILSDSENNESVPDDQFVGKDSIYQTHYDADKQKVADAYFDTWAEIDDRDEVQQKVFGKSWNELYDWTVTIGDVTLMVPPTSITVINSTVNNKLHLMRARGSMPKGGSYSQREITMPVYFAGDDAINGYVYESTAPNGTTMTYGLNGLRALISEFKFTPFLPVDNKYLNETLGIYAVALQNIEIQNMPSIGPRLMQVTLILKEFNYEAYIPEAAVLGQCMGAKNPFSSAINWPTMRYYYQRAIMAGNKLAASGYDFNSKEYMHECLRNRTALQPMKFESSAMEFYLADPDYLDEMQERREERDRARKYSISFTKDDKEALNSMEDVANTLSDALNSDDFKKVMDDNFKDIRLQINPNQNVNATMFPCKQMPSDTGLYAVDKEGNIRNDVDPNARMNDVCAALLDKVKANENVQEATMYYHHNADRKEMEFGVRFRLKDVSDETVKSLQKNLGPIAGLSDSETDNIKGSGLLHNGWMYIPFTVYEDFDKNPDGGLSVDGNNPNIKALEYAKNRSKSDTSNNGDLRNDDQWEKAANISELDNMRFKHVDAGNFVITSYACSQKNIFSDIHIQSTGKLCSQFMGGTDVSLSINIMTTDTQAVSMIEALPDLATSMMRRYRRIIPCYPIKVDSEITRFLGVSEVMIDDVNVSTIPGHPGAYNIQLIMTSMDRTLRNREAAEMLQADNAGYYNSSIADKIADSLQGKQDRMTVYEQANMKSYFDIMYSIAHAELYPDLELPKLDEMASLGYTFMRYKFQDGRIYVDPDFYFLYMTRLSSQVLRETILNSISSGIDGSATISDKTGAEFNITPAINAGYEAVAKNENAKSQKERIEALKSAQHSSNIKTTPENLREGQGRIGVAVEDYEAWEICNDIKAVFMEKRYRKEADSYDARQKNASLNQTAVNYNSVADSFPNLFASVIENNKGKSKEELKEELAKAFNGQVEALKTQNQYDEKITSLQEAYTAALGKAEQSNNEQQKSAEKKVKSNNPEGAWVVSQLESANSAAEKIELFLKTKPIGLSAPETSMVREKFLKVKKNNDDTSSCYNSMRTEIGNGVSSFFATAEVMEIMELLGIEVESSFLAVVKDIIFSEACSATGDKEYSSKKKATNWMPAPNYIGSKQNGGVQNVSNATLCTELDEAVMEATEFGAFAIKQYSLASFQAITGEKPENEWSEEDRKADPVNTSNYLLDPYYRNSDVATIREYKKGCINSPKYCAVAFLRNSLYWLRYLILKRAFPSINADVLRKTAKAEKEIKEAEDKNKIPESGKDQDLRDHLTFFSKNTYTIDAGKIWTCSMLALSDGSKMLRDRIDNRDYRALNEYLHGVSVPSTPISPEDKLSSGMRKAYLAMAGLNRIENKNAIGVRQDAPSNQEVQKEDNKLYIAAAEDPSQFMVHACHDMIVYDARGRMVRAFPTYYMLMIDEGRTFGSYKLQDNFYNTMNIISFDVVKDRKNPADTANIVLTNMYQAFDTDEGDRLRSKELGNKDIFRSVFSPSTLGEDAAIDRQSAGAEEQLRLRPGARIHLRAGYGSNAVMMPVIFNGIIAEMDASETINIVAQGDGIELMNPIMEEMEAHNIDQQAHWASNGDTPKNIVNGMLTTSGGWIASAMKSFGRPDILGDSPYGIYHFGNKDFKNIVGSGEPTQNIFEAWDSPVWGDVDDPTTKLGINSAPSISFDVFGKTPWDVINICRSVKPDFIAAVAPFDFRSTVFMGAPRYYYAYSYMNTDGSIREKRKPYQQYHIYTSDADIIGNGVTATSKYMKTTATGLYQVAASLNTKEQHKVGPLYADIDLFPENQKAMIVDTQLFAKGMPVIGYLTNIVTSFEIVDEIVGNDDSSAITGGHNMRAKGVAWNMTASALKDSMKEMYAGDLIVLGDPSVKPHDRIYINDTYTGITGQCTAKEVVISMSVNNGFTTAISPDLINTVDDKYEQIIHRWFTQAPMTYVALGAMAFNTLRVLGLRTTTAADAGAIKRLLTNNKAAESIAKYGGKYTPTIVKDGAKGLIGLVGKGAKTVLGAVEVAGAELGPPGWAASIATFIIESAVIDGVCGWLANKMNNLARDLQVITVYPLKRYGLPWTAGLGGSKGMIYGTPSFGDDGVFTQMVNAIAGVEKPTDNAALGQEDPSMVLARLTASELDNKENYSSAINRAKHKSGSTDKDGEEYSNQEMFNSRAQAALSQDVKSDYRSMQFAPRADFSKGDDVIQAYTHFALLDTEKYSDDPKMDYVSLISEDRRLRPYINEGFFKIIHETPALNVGAYVDAKVVSIKGQRKYIKTMEYRLSNGDLVYDMPLLNKEALHILYEIIRRAKNSMPAANSSDPYESYEETKSSFIALESALRVGDSQSLAAAGYTFILQGVDNALQPMMAAVKELNDEIAADAKKHNGAIESSLFDSRVDETDQTKIAIVVRMPRVTGTAAGDEPAVANSDEETTEE